MKNLFFFFFILFGNVFELTSEIYLPALINDNMVLQQQSLVKLWGSAAPNKQIKVHTTWTSKPYYTKSNNNGNWILSLKTPIAGGPYSITFSDGKEKKISNVLIGEVWLCSGQSNMEMPMKGYPGQPVNEAQNAIAKADPSIPIRFITVEKNNSLKQLDDFQSIWHENNPLHVKDLSAIAYFYAVFLQSTLKVPIGIIASSWGGSSIEAWMDSTTLSQFIGVKLTNENNTKPVFQRHCQLYNGMIYPLQNFTIKGVLWYQGEANSNQYTFYKKAFPAMVASWRKSWGIGNYPFYFAQISPWKYNGIKATDAARLREVQQSFLNEVPNSGMVVTIDTGDSIMIHPKMKKEIGERFAYWALANTYERQGIEYRAPEFKSMKITNDTLVLDFNYVQEGLNSKSQQISGFEIAGIDSVFKPATAMLINKGSKIRLTEKTIKTPIAARYAFGNYTPASLFSNLGLPLAPFRTDNWDDKRQLKKENRL